jgi:hypothetical protein
MRYFPLIVFFLLILPTSSATIIAFEPSSLDIKAGTQESVIIHVDPTQAIDTVATDYIFWDANIVDCVGVQRGDLFNETTIWITGTIDNNKGTIKKMVWASATPTDEPGTFVTLVFYGKKDGTTKIIINDSDCGIARNGTDVAKTLYNACMVSVYGDGNPDNPLTAIPLPFLIIIVAFIVVIIILAIQFLMKKK